MKLDFIKIDKIEEKQDHKIIRIPTGGLTFIMRDKFIQSTEPIEIEMTHEGIYQNTVRDIRFSVYTDQSINPISEIKTENLFSIVAHVDVERAIYLEIAKRCKIVPMHKSVDERELFARECGTAYKQLMGVQ